MMKAPLASVTWVAATQLPPPEHRQAGINILIISIIIVIISTALAQIPISTFSHIWVFVRQYGVMFVIIVIIIIIIIIYRKVKVSTLKHV